MYFTMRSGNVPKTIRTLEAPHTLEAAIWLDPGDVSSSYVELSGSDVSALHPKIGANMVVSQSTASARPLLNTPGNFASGRNTMTFDGAMQQHLFGHGATDVLSSFDGPSPWTVAMNMSFSATGSSQTQVSFTHNTSNLNNISLYHYSSAPYRAAPRYRSVTNIAQAIASSDNIVLDVPVWWIFDYDGDNTISIQVLGGNVYTGTGASVPGADSIFNALYIGGFSALGWFYGEMGDMVAFNRKLNTEDRQTLITWLESRL